MKHLKHRKIFESNIDDINYIFMEIRDDGYNVDINKTRKDNTQRITINRTYKNYGRDSDGIFNFEKPFMISEIIDVVERIIRINNQVSLYDIKLYNKYANNKFNRLSKDKKMTWKNFLSIINREFDLKTQIKEIVLLVEL